MWLAEVHDGCLAGSKDAQFAALLNFGNDRSFMPSYSETRTCMAM